MRLWRPFSSSTTSTSEFEFEFEFEFDGGVNAGES